MTVRLITIARVVCIACSRDADSQHCLWGQPCCSACAHSELAQGACCEWCEYRSPRRIDSIAHLQQMAGSATTLSEARWLRDHLLDLSLLDIERMAAGDIWHLTADDTQWHAAVAAMCEAHTYLVRG